MSERINASEFARREGCNEKQVRRGVERGALVRGDDGLIDAAQVGTAWRRANRRTLQKATQRPHVAAATQSHMRNGETPPGAAVPVDGALPAMTLAEAICAKETWLARLRELEYEQKAGRLVELELAERAVFDLCRTQRDSWLAWPTKVAPFLAPSLA